MAMNPNIDVPSNMRNFNEPFVGSAAVTESDEYETRVRVFVIVKVKTLSLLTP